MSAALLYAPVEFRKILERHGPRALVDSISPWLTKPAGEVDRALSGTVREDLVAAVTELNDRRAREHEAFYCQQLLLSRIYELSMTLPDAVTAEGSVVLHEVTRLLEEATVAAEDELVDFDLISSAPTDPQKYLGWIRDLARRHRAYKHPYYVDFIRNRADRDMLRTYVIQESVVDARFDDLLALMQVGTSGEAKMEIASNFWDEMGNGDPAQVHTTLFSQIFDVLDITPRDLAETLSAEALLSGNLTVMVSRYRRLHAEAVGYLGTTEWLAPDRFVHVVHAWERLGLPEVGSRYHRLHVTIDARHASGWFRRVVHPAVRSDFMRRGITRGVLWRLNSSARYLNERMADVG